MRQSDASLRIAWLRVQTWRNSCSSGTEIHVGKVARSTISGHPFLQVSRLGNRLMRSPILGKSPLLLAWHGDRGQYTIVSQPISRHVRGIMVRFGWMLMEGTTYSTSPSTTIWRELIGQVRFPRIASYANFTTMERMP